MDKIEALKIVKDIIIEDMPSEGDDFYIKVINFLDEFIEEERWQNYLKNERR